MSNHSRSVLATWDIPSTTDLLEHLHALRLDDSAADRAVRALEGGVFLDDSNQKELLNGVQNPIEQAALLVWLARHCPTSLSIEIGFGMGMTSCLMLASRVRELPRLDFDHLIFDPFGLGEERGSIVESFLQRTYGQSFRRCHERSQFGIANLASVNGDNQCALAFVDGDHSFEGALADFYMLDKVMTIGGLIVFDDAAFPAIETIINFIRCNRPDYQISHLEIPNTAVIKKTDIDRRSWDHFQPFPVPNRSNWTHVNDA